MNLLLIRLFLHIVTIAVNRIQLAARLSEARFAHGKGGLRRDSRSLVSMTGFKSVF